jgi:predicted O-methyltransferase YrrM
MMICRTPEEVMALSRNFMGSRILFTGAELNIFDLLQPTSLTALEIADRLRTDIRGTAILLDALASMGLLVKNNDAYQCTPSLAPYLSSSDPNSVMPMVLHASHLWQRWSRLTEIVKGEAKAGADRTPSYKDGELSAFIGAMHSISAPHAGEVINQIDPGSSKALLDLGGASGTYTLAFLKNAPGMKATLFDLPEVIELARERLQREGMLDRVSLVGGNYLRDDLPQGHDLAFLSAVIHSNNPEQNLNIYTKVFRSLLPGGRVVIRDHVMESDRTHSEAGALFAVNMLVATQGGRTYTFDEISDGLAQAGFHNVRLLKKSDRMDAMVEAYKPRA